jgi:hypothetical protein
MSVLPWSLSLHPSESIRMRQPFVFPSLLACAVACSLALPGRASANIVINGGFETGDFSGWTQIGNTDFTGVTCAGVGSAPEGSCAAFFGPGGSTGGIQQTLGTVIGQGVVISFDYHGDGGLPGYFEVDFGGQVLLAQTNALAATHTYTFNAIATTATTNLTFLFRDDTGFMSLDNVQAAAVPEPGSLALMGIGLAGLVAWRKRSGREMSGR